MAHLHIEGIDIWDDIFNALSHPEEIAKDAINEAAPVAEKAVQAAVKASSNSDKLANSFKLTPAKENSLGVYSVIHANGDFNKDLSNEDLAAQFEYGRPGGYKRADMQRPATTMAARPFLERAKNDAREQCEEIIQNKVFDAVDKAVGG